MRKIKVTMVVKATPREIAKKYNVSLAEVNRQLSKGVKVEHEHTKNKQVAEKIAIDHLLERLDYYKKFKN